MKFRFHINYHTEWGEALYIVGSVPALGDSNPEKALEMTLARPVGGRSGSACPHSGF